MIRKEIRRLVLTGIIMGLFLLSGPSQGFAATNEELETQVKAMAETVEQLQKKIQEMQAQIDENKKAAKARPPIGVEDVRSGFTSFMKQFERIVKVSGYYDFEFANDDKKDSPGEFKQHHLSIFLEKRIDPWHFFTELEFEFAPTTEGSGETLEGTGEIHVERAWLEWNHSDLFNVRGGFILLPNYWTTYHYPSIIISTSTPDMVKRVFPSDTTGLMAYGTRYWDNDFGLTYHAVVGNGEAANPAKDDANENKVGLGKLTAHIPMFDRFDVAGVVSIGKNASDVDETMIALETQLNIGDFELLTEVQRNSANGDVGKQLGYYIQPSYKLLPKWTAFYRYDVRDDDSKIDDADDIIRHTAGIRYQPMPIISLKAEVFRAHPDDSTSEIFNGLLTSAVIFF